MQVEKVISYLSNKGIAPNIARTLGFLTLDGINMYTNKERNGKAGRYTRNQLKGLKRLEKELK